MGKKSRRRRTPTVERKTAPKIDLQKLSKVIQNADLHLIRLERLDCRTGSLRDQPPQYVHHSIEIEVRRQDGGNNLLVIFRFMLHASYEESPTSSPPDDAPFLMNATFNAFFAFPAEEALDEAHLGLFGQQIGLHAVWPYWRELVQSIAQKMALPAITVPLLKMGSFARSKE